MVLSPDPTLCKSFSQNERRHDRRPGRVAAVNLSVLPVNAVLAWALSAVGIEFNYVINGNQALMLVVLSVFLIWESYQRLRAPEPINDEVMWIVASIGLVVNLGIAWGVGGHDGKQAGAIFPDAVRWIWKDWPKEPQAGAGSKQLQDILIPGEGWQLVSEGHAFTDGPCADDKGNFYFSDLRATPPTVWKVAPDGAKSNSSSSSMSGTFFFLPEPLVLMAAANYRQTGAARDRGGRDRNHWQFCGALAH